MEVGTRVSTPTGREAQAEYVTQYVGLIAP